MSENKALNPEDLEAIRKRWAAATRGPWRWFGYLKNHDVGLIGPGMTSIMECRRWGMSGAQPLFCVDGMLTPLSELVAPDTVPGRGRVTAVNHPDATAIAHSWEDVHALLAHVGALEEQREAVREEGRQKGLAQAAVEAWHATLRHNGSADVKLASAVQSDIEALLLQSPRIYSELETQRRVRRAYEEGFREGLKRAVETVEAEACDIGAVGRLRATTDDYIQGILALADQPVPPRPRCRTCPGWCEGTKGRHDAAGPCRDCGCSAWA